MTSRVLKKLRILDFDIETIAAGFADPDWVPQKITCVAWSWIGEDKVESEIATVLGLFGKPERRAKMLKPLLAAINEADMLTGHNIIRFDLPVLNAECLRLGLSSLPARMVQDTMRFVKTKGFKKGQDNVGRLLRVPAEKMALDWQAWQAAYDESDWQTVRDRCASDIIQHKLIRQEMLDRGWMKSPIMWRP
jgi:DNA polymerase elongation subunit (family B)